MSFRTIGLRTRAFPILTAAVLAVGLGVGSAWSAPGTVLSKQKISETVGGFGGNKLSAADEFGGALASLGDLDGPGPSVVAVAVGCYGDDDGGTNRGAVFVLFLNSAGTVLSHRKISDLDPTFQTTLADGDEFGSSVASLGDLDGPGPSVAALAVGSAFDDTLTGVDDRGAVYILFLNEQAEVLSHRKINATSGGLPAATLDPLDEFGTSVANLGDLDGAGPSVVALAVGAGGDDDGGTGPDVNHGAVYILFLDASGAILSMQKISSTAGNFTGILDPEDEFGVYCAALGDLDGAGPTVQAMAIGAAGDDDGGIDRGALYIVFLTSSGTVFSATKISDLTPNFDDPLEDEDDFGSSLAWLGDLDGPGPGVATLAVGSARDNDGGAALSDRGAVHVLFLDSAGGIVSDTTISTTKGGFGAGLDVGDQFGAAMGALGDIDGAGPALQTLVGGAPFDDDGATNQGAFYVMFLDGVCPTILLAPASLPNATVGTAYSEIITASGGTSPYGFAVTVGAEPPGLTLGSDGTLAGTPTTAGNFTLTVQATDAAGCSGNHEYTITVCPVITLSPSTLPDGTVGTEYSQTITASGGTEPYTFSVAEGTLPPGLELSTAGALTGPPTSQGTYNFTVGATGSEGGGCSGQQAYTIEVIDPTAVDTIRAVGRTGLRGIFPNPMGRAGQLVYEIAHGGPVRLTILDVAGKQVRVLDQGERSPGLHRVAWDGHDDRGRALNGGVYFVQMVAAGRSQGVLRIVVVK